MSENPEIYVGIDISKDTLDIGFQPPGHTGELPYGEQGISEATRRLREAEPRRACPWYRAWTPSMTASPRRLSGRSVISCRGPGKCHPARPHLQGAGAAWPVSPMAALRERRAPGSEGMWRHPLGTKGSIVYCR
jgi:hypothetical protein